MSTPIRRVGEEKRSRCRLKDGCEADACEMLRAGAKVGGFRRRVRAMFVPWSAMFALWSHLFVWVRIVMVQDGSGLQVVAPCYWGMQ